MARIGSQIGEALLGLLRGGKYAAALEEYAPVAKALQAGRTIKSYAPKGHLLELVLDDGSKLSVNPTMGAAGARFRTMAKEGTDLDEIAQRARPSVKTAAGTRVVPPSKGVRLPALEAAGRKFRAGALEEPLLTAGGAVAGASFLGGTVGQSISDVLSGPGNVRRTAEAASRAQWEDLRSRAQEERTQRIRDTNAARLAAMRPDLYNQVVSGRVLPTGAIPLGGSPRLDLVDQATRMMMTGPSRGSGGGLGGALGLVDDAAMLASRAV